ncbi:MAG: toprim domain-containing protein [Chloroflexota bacterium]
MTLPRDEILARVDLRALADELLGPRRPAGVSGMWPCPAPDHGPQTGHTPPVSIFTATNGESRWHCHGCSVGGTAIDLVMTTAGLSVRGALEDLARRASLAPNDHRDVVHPVRPATVVPSRRAEPWARRAVIEHVARCAQLLHTELGRPMREWLHARGLDDATLTANQVGADPGPRHLPRARGLPGRGPAVILPARRDGQPVFFQARYLDPERVGGRRYDNPASWIVPNPRSTAINPATASPSGTPVVVCEGVMDALSVAQLGYRAVAVLGAGLIGPHLAEQLHASGARSFVLAFDADTRGAHASERLGDELARRGASVVALELPAGCKDVNDWLRVDTQALGEGLAATATSLTLADPGMTLTL